MKSFESWLFDEVEDTFSIKRVETLNILTNWLSVIPNISDSENAHIKQKSIHLQKNVATWNEDELKMFFIGPFIDIANFYSEHYKSFTQRSLTLKTEK